jgi:hypothetical protein
MTGLKKNSKKNNAFQKQKTNPKEGMKDTTSTRRKELLTKNLLGIGPLCDLGWKLKVIIVQRV